MKRNSSKSVNPNTSKAKVAKRDTSYVAPGAADMIWMHKAGIEKLIDEMYEAIMTDDSIDSVLDFLVRRRIPRANYYRWKAQYPELADAHDIFNSIIGNRLFKRVNYDVKTIHHVMPNYDPQVWKDMVEYHNDLKKDIAKSSASTNIIADNWKKIMEQDE